MQTKVRIYSDNICTDKTRVIQQMSIEAMCFHIRVNAALWWRNLEVNDPISKSINLIVFQIGSRTSKLCHQGCRSHSHMIAHSRIATGRHLFYTIIT